MKKKIYKHLCIIMSIVIVITSTICVSLNVFAADSGTSGSLNWSIDTASGVMTISGIGYGDNYTSSFGMPWYSNRNNIKSVVVQEGVQALGDNWFVGFIKIVSVELPDSLVKIGANCFKNCSSLAGITIPANCTELYNNIFYGCTALKWAVLPNDSSASTYSHIIPDGTFNRCTSLEQVYVGSGFTGIDKNVFYNCSALSSVVWSGNTFDFVNANAFNKPTNTLNFIGKDSISTFCTSKNYKYQTYTGACATGLNYTYDLLSRELSFTGSDGVAAAPWTIYSYLIKKINYKNITSSICDNAFMNCAPTENKLDLDSSIVSIGSKAFYNAGYKTITINADKVSIGSNAFDNSKAITFYGNRNSGVYDYVKSERTSPDLWKYYCINHFHSYDIKAEGSTCSFCDKPYGKISVTELGEHKYIYQAKTDDKLHYRCSDCGISDHMEELDNVIADFEFAVSGNGTAYNQNDYDGRFDIQRDSYINADDFAILNNMKKGIATGYEMTLSNPNATKTAKTLYNYIASTYKNGLLTGQQESTWMGADYEFKYIQQKTGKLPAIRGFDFMNDDFNGVVSRAKTWANKGGIVTICWHCSSAFDKSYDQSKADTMTAEQWTAMLTPGTAQNKATLNAMDKAGKALLELQKAGIPVIWRPFHEFDGAWFWWGKGGSENFKKLWTMMYEHYTYDLGLNNLIWMLGYSHNGTDYGTNLADWYPGNQYCDIVGADSYEVDVNGGEARLYNPVYALCNGTKPMAMHETGKIPTVEQFESVPWAYFMTWHTEYLTTKNTADELKTIYNSSRAITLDELPNLYA